ncbi:MAG: hypothetical protein LQ345_006918 [Seirophora villosa]|nr:MAG: hypothetical protein LQ345_006918 [Seirophora villosa]
MGPFEAASASASALAIAHDLFTMQYGVETARSRGDHREYKLNGPNPEALAKGKCNCPPHVPTSHGAGLHLMLGKLVAVLQWFIVFTLTENLSNRKEGAMHKKGVMYNSSLARSAFMVSATAFIRKNGLTDPVLVSLAAGYILSGPMWTRSSHCSAAQRAKLTSCWAAIVFAAMASARFKASVLEALLVFLPYSV